MTDVYAHANPHFIDAVGRRAVSGCRVLDVGCWNGTLGRELIARFGCSVDGIERDPGQAARARLVGYGRVHERDLDRADWEGIDRAYDVICLGDVLEHLVDPERTLVEAMNHLAEGGEILVSIPNVAFVSNRLNLLRGRWNYADYGILDRTHLRFFTLQTMHELLRGCGLTVTRTLGYAGLYGHPAWIREPVRWLARRWPALFAIQIVMVASRRGPDR